jgi:nucleoside diphosphate kinase
MFSRTGLRIIGCKLVRMTVAQALEFYGPVRPVLARKLARPIAARARELLEEGLGVPVPESSLAGLAECVGVPYANEQFERIVEFMTGQRPSDTPEDKRHQQGRAGCLAIVYEGEGAVAKIRDVLGPTDPSKAPFGTVRREFGHNVMINTAHASDSPENALREMAILKMDEPNLLEQVHAYSRSVQ